MHASTVPGSARYDSTFPCCPESLVIGIDFALLHIGVASRHEGGGSSRASPGPQSAGSQPQCDTNRYRKETSMSTHLRPSRTWIGGLAPVLVGPLRGLGWGPRPPAPGGSP